MGRCDPTARDRATVFRRLGPSLRQPLRREDFIPDADVFAKTEGNTADSRVPRNEQHEARRLARQERRQQSLRGQARGMWVLSSDQPAIADDVNRPVGLLREDGT
jgi:hypothetical protein